MNKKRSCPSCKKIIDESHDPQWLPFCGERCKLVDFGDWIEGRHSIPSEDSASEHDLIISNDDPTAH